MSNPRLLADQIRELFNQAAGDSADWQTEDMRYLADMLESLLETMEISLNEECTALLALICEFFEREK